MFERYKSLPPNVTDISTTRACFNQLSKEQIIDIGFSRWSGVSEEDLKEYVDNREVILSMISDEDYKILRDLVLQLMEIRFYKDL